MIRIEDITITEEQINTFLDYYESCFNCRLEELSNHDLLFLLNAARSKHFLHYLYSHM